MDIMKIKNILDEVKFPIAKPELIDLAKKKGAEQPIIEKLESIKTDVFHSKEEVMSGFEKLGNLSGII
jgi:hypothetical protein